jgi:hypothetical protein
LGLEVALGLDPCELGTLNLARLPIARRPRLCESSFSNDRWPFMPPLSLKKYDLQSVPLDQWVQWGKNCKKAIFSPASVL